MLRCVSLHNGVHKHQTQKDLSDHPKDSISTLKHEFKGPHKMAHLGSLWRCCFICLLLALGVVLPPYCTQYTFQGWVQGLRTYHGITCQVIVLGLYKGNVFLQATGKQHRDGTQPQLKEPDLLTVGRCVYIYKFAEWIDSKEKDSRWPQNDTQGKRDPKCLNGFSTFSVHGLCVLSLEQGLDHILPALVVFLGVRVRPPHVHRDALSAVSQRVPGQFGQILLYHICGAAFPSPRGNFQTTFLQELCACYCMLQGRSWGCTGLGPE